MRLLDRYVLREYLGPFLFGMGAFAVILIGMQVAPFVLRLLVKEQVPAGIVLRIFILRLPQALVLTFPMATIFGALMSMSNMSSSGEIIAVRAGGVSLRRLSAAVLIAGLAVSLLNFGFNELVLPQSLEAAYQLQVGFAGRAKPIEHLTFSIPSTGEPQRIIYARRFDPRHKRLEGLMIVELRNGTYWQIFNAEMAEWYGEEWVLRNVEHTTVRPEGEQVQRLREVTAEVGKTPEELMQKRKSLDDMSIAQLRHELQQRQRLGLQGYPIRQVVQYINMRKALPWIPLGFTLIGIPLGLRPVRASSALGLGLSLAIAFAYYVFFQALHLIGQQGTMPSLVAAWLPNGVLFGAGIMLFVNAQR
jgi:lipopolysaccharide export system permease protein